MEEKLHIVISVKDFKAIIAHAGITNVILKVLYSKPCSPLQLSYSEEGILSEFILMTCGESRSASSTPAPNASRVAKRPAPRQPLEATSSSKRTAPPEMPPPPRSTTASFNREASRPKMTRPSPPPPQPSIQSQSLFLPQADDDRRWDPAAFDEEEDEMLLWDQGGEKARISFCFKVKLLTNCRIPQP